MLTSAGQSGHNKHQGRQGPLACPVRPVEREQQPPSRAAPVLHKGDPVRVLLLNPPPLADAPQATTTAADRGGLAYPLWLASAAGLLEDGGFRVSVLDAPASFFGWRDVVRRACLFHPDLIVVELATLPDEDAALLAGAIKHELPSATLVLVGAGATAAPLHSLRCCPAADAVAPGEYEGTLLDLATRLDQARDWHTVPGIAYRTTSGRLVATPDRPDLADLDVLPFVSRVYHQHLQVQHYGYGVARTPMVAISVGRATPHDLHTCLCGSLAMAQSTRWRSPGNVAAELAELGGHLPPVREALLVGAPVHQPGWLAELCATLSRERNPVAWSLATHPGLPPQDLALMRRAGARALYLALPPTDAAFPDGGNEALTALCRAARAAGLAVYGCMGSTTSASGRSTAPARRLGLQAIYSCSCVSGEPSTARLTPLTWGALHGAWTRLRLGGGAVLLPWQAAPRLLASRRPLQAVRGPWRLLAALRRRIHGKLSSSRRVGDPPATKRRA